MTSSTSGTDRFGICSEEFFQGLWSPACNLTNRISGPAAFLTIPKIAPKMGQMIERVRVDWVFYSLGPLLVCDCRIANRPTHNFTKSFDNLLYSWSFAHQLVYLFGRKLGAGQKSCGASGYVFGDGQRNDSVSITPREKHGILCGHASADKRAYILVVGWCLNMNGPNLRPIKNSIGQPMLQIPKRRSVSKVSKRLIIGCALKLRIVHDQFQSGIAGRCSKDRSGFEKAIGHWIREVCALYIPHSRLNRNRIEEITFDDLSALLTEFIASSIEFVDEGANGKAVRGQ